MFEKPRRQMYNAQLNLKLFKQYIKLYPFLNIQPACFYANPYNKCMNMSRYTIYLKSTAPQVKIMQT